MLEKLLLVVFQFRAQLLPIDIDAVNIILEGFESDKFRSSHISNNVRNSILEIFIGLLICIDNLLKDSLLDLS